MLPESEATLRPVAANDANPNPHVLYFARLGLAETLLAANRPAEALNDGLVPALVQNSADGGLALRAAQTALDARLTQHAQLLIAHAKKTKHDA
eukprot:3820148-Pleurochrysis_carterae.AAC.1